MMRIDETSIANWDIAEWVVQSHEWLKVVYDKTRQDNTGMRASVKVEQVLWMEVPWVRFLPAGYDVGPVDVDYYMLNDEEARFATEQAWSYEYSHSCVEECSNPLPPLQ